MKRAYSMSSLITVISLLFGVIWLSPALATAAPAFASLGQIKMEGLQVPGAMDLDGAGNLYVTDGRGSGLVSKYSPYGVLLRSFSLGASGRGLAVTADGGRLYVARNKSVVIVDASSGAELGLLSGGVESNGAEFRIVGKIALDALGNVFVVDQMLLQVKVYNAAGQYQSRFGGVGLTPGLFMGIGGMAISPSGQVIVADTTADNAKIHVFEMNTDLTVKNVVTYLRGSAANFGSPAMIEPCDVTFDALKRVYILDAMSAQVRVTSESFVYQGAYTQTGTGVGQLNDTKSLVFDEVNSRLFVACADTGRIEILGVDNGQNPDPADQGPPTPTQQSPVAGSEVDSVNPTLVINNVTDPGGNAVTYHVAVSRDGTVVFQADVPAVEGDTTSVVVGAELAENMTFSWTVQATAGDLSSDVSVAASFVVNAVEEAPSTPELVAPLNGESINGLDALSWGAASDPDPNDQNITYHVEVALDASFTQIVATEALVATALPLNGLAAYSDLADGVGYFWRVAALDDGLTASAPSSAGQFTYDTTSLTVTANMPDAVVSLHGNHAFAGQSIGFAPIELRDVSPGTMSVVVTRTGFEPFVAAITLVEGDNVELHALLAPAMSVTALNVSRSGINGRSGLAVSGAAAPFMVDFDNDGDLDLLVGDGSGQITLFANLQVAGRNKLYFDQGVSLGLSVMPGAVPFVADWDNDGRKDLLIGQADGSVKLLLNTGLDEAPAFAYSVDVQTVGGTLNAGSNAAPAVIDYNRDGAKDLLVGNASGQVLVYLNQGVDAAPVLSASPSVLLQVGSAVVPFPVDWNADGQRELMLSTRDSVTVYALVDNEFQVSQQFNSDGRSTYFGAFPIDLEGTGKHFMVGQVDGQLIYLTGNNAEPVASFQVALQDKVSELGDLVADADATKLPDVAALGVLVEASDYVNASSSANALALQLPEGAAKASAIELANLCQ